MCDLHKSEIRNPKSGINYIDLLGKPFEYGGRGPDTYDCWGLCMEIYKRLGIQLPDGVSSADWKMIETQIKSEITNPKSEIFTEIPHPRPYCLVTFMIRPPYT